jgi:hypothetical protein
MRILRVVCSDWMPSFGRSVETTAELPPVLDRVDMEVDKDSGWWRRGVASWRS